jgi:predicted site-specific integrase-resolvase
MKITLETEDLLTIPQAAQMIGVSRITAWQWANDGKMAVIILGGKSLVTRKTAEAIKRRREFEAEELRIQRESK